MNNTLKMMALGAALMLSSAFASTSFAQAGSKMSGQPGAKMDGKMGGPGGRRGGRRGQGGMMRRAAKELGLSEAQKTKLTALMKSTGDKRKAIREDKKLTPDQKRTKMKALRTSSEASMKAILTPAQRTKLAAMQAQMAQRMRENGGKMGGRMGGPGAR